MRRVALGVICAVTMVACGSGSSSTKATTTLPPAPKVTTTTVPGATVEVRPASGPVGTSFQILGTRFQSAESVTFEIVFPDAKVFKGQPHKATADGTVSATFRVTNGNPPGTYQVKATGDKGTQALGQFEVSTGAATTTTAVGRTSTTVAGRSTTTKKP